ncbi:MAG: hypothetical protein LBQ28_05545 [Prevotellaceae bacterium]|jgi:hypothetical protein|nr:hypothetical protein [Prevotellaceae bacterium]
MKKILVVFVFTALFVACSTIMPRYSIISGTIDYSYFTKKGFFITESNSVSFEYTPVGSVFTTIYSGETNETGKRELVVKDDFYPYKIYITSKKWKSADVDDALLEIYNQALNIGANGIINLKIQNITSSQQINGQSISCDGITVSGMAIKK